MHVGKSCPGARFNEPSIWILPLSDWTGSLDECGFYWHVAATQVALLAADAGLLICVTFDITSKMWTDIAQCIACIRQLLRCYLDLAVEPILDDVFDAIAHVNVLD